MVATLKCDWCVSTDGPYPGVKYYITVLGGYDGSLRDMTVCDGHAHMLREWEHIRTHFTTKKYGQFYADDWIVSESWQSV